MALVCDHVLIPDRAKAHGPRSLGHISRGLASSLVGGFVLAALGGAW